MKTFVILFLSPFSPISGLKEISAFSELDAKIQFRHEFPCYSIISVEEKILSMTFIFILN